MDRWVTQFSDLESKRPLWKWFLADKTILDGQTLKEALDDFAEVGLRQRKNTVKKPSLTTGTRCTLECL